MKKICLLGKIFTSVFFVFLIASLGHAGPSDFDIGFLAGLSPASNILEVTPHGYGDIDYHMRTFKIRSSVALEIASSMTQEAEGISDPMLRIALIELAKDIKSAPTNGYGDIDYWIAEQKTQDIIFERSSAKIKRLEELFAQGQQITLKREMGYLKGIEIALKAMTIYSSGYGDVDYHKRTFDLRKDIANSIAKGILENLKYIQDMDLRAKLEEIAIDIGATPQSGYGDIDYWTDKLVEQKRAFKRIAENFDLILVEKESNQNRKQQTIVKRRQTLALKKFVIILSSEPSAKELHEYLNKIDLLSIGRTHWSNLMQAMPNSGRFMSVLDVFIVEVQKSSEQTRASILIPLRDAMAANDYLFQSYNQTRSKLGFKTVNSIDAGWPSSRSIFCEMLFD